MNLSTPRPLIPTLDSISASVPSPSSIPNQADPETYLEQDNLAGQERSAKLAGLKQDIDERKKYAFGLFVLVCVWLATVLLTVLLQGFGSAGTQVLFCGVWWKFRLGDSTILALIGATTVNVIALFVVVLTYLFPKRLGSSPRATRKIHGRQRSKT